MTVRELIKELLDLAEQEISLDEKVYIRTDETEAHMEISPEDIHIEVNGDMILERRFPM